MSASRNKNFILNKKTNKMKCYELIFALLIWIPLVFTANILGLFPLPSKSHFTMIDRLLTRLAKDGHNVDIVTHFPDRHEPIARYKQLSLAGSFPLPADTLIINEFEKLTFYETVEIYSKPFGVEVCKSTLATQVLQNLKKTTTKYDLVITELFAADCMLAFGYYFKIPTIAITTSVYLPWSNDNFGLSDNPSYIPTYFTPSVTKQMGFFKRLQNTIYLVLSKLLYYYYTSKDVNKIVKDFFGPHTPDVEDLARNISLGLANSHFSINNAVPTVPNSVEVGGLHIQDPKPLPSFLEKFMTTDINKGVIYFTLGTHLLSNTIDLDKLQALFDVFASLPYKILWKADRNKFDKSLIIPNNIHFENWLPQIDVLCHKNTRLFISHGGLMSAQEAIYCGVPRIGIPIFGDQRRNVEMGEQLKILVKVEYADINKETISMAIEKILNNQSYKLRCEELAAQFKDRPSSALDTAVYWIEYVLRYNGAPQLRTVGADLPWYKYHLVDVTVFLLLVLVFLLFLIQFFINLCLKTVTYTLLKYKRD